jgi:hypothetical protein
MRLSLRLAALTAASVLLAGRPLPALDCRPAGDGLDPGLAKALGRLPGSAARRVESRCALATGLELQALTSDDARGETYLVPTDGREPKRLAAGQPRAAEPIRDRSGHPYAVIETGVQTSSSRSRELTLVDLETLEARSLMVGEGDSRTGGCAAQGSAGPAVAAKEMSVSIEDKDRDGHPDVIVHAVMEDCRTGSPYHVTKTLVAVPHGFSETVQWTGGHGDH